MHPEIGAESSVGIQDNPRQKTPVEKPDIVVYEWVQVGPIRVVDTILTIVLKRNEMEIIRGYSGVVFVETKKQARLWLSGLADASDWQGLLIVA
jgi:hypothetical protein